jgi:predicted PurR-regulated permease PerM
MERSTSTAHATALLSQGINIITGVVNVGIVFIVAVYILADQGRSLDGLIRRLPPAREAKLRRTIPAVTTVINGYVAGQTFNSLLFGTFALVLLSSLDVPSAAVLAIIAAIGDAIPQVGVTLATIPAVLLALTKSWQAAVIVLVAYVIYQQIENYVIAPRVFGKTLGLSPLITMIAVLVGAKLLGIIGVLIALPIAAAIPEVVRIWSEPDVDPADADPDAAQPLLAPPKPGTGDAPG